ncbi:MAG: ABC transporter permease [Chloroflexota bacterium]
MTPQSAFLAIVKKELASVARERTILIAILIQLFIASFSSALLIGLLSLYDPDSVSEYRQLNLNVAFVDALGGPLSGYIEARGVRVYTYPTLDAARAGYYRGEVSAIIAVPQDQGGLVQMELYLPRAQATSALILTILQDPLRRYENYLRQMRGIEVRYTDLQGRPATTFEFIYSMIIPILMFFPAFVAGGMVVDSISEEVVNYTLPTLLSTPVTLGVVVNAKITAAILLALVQCAAWLALLQLNQIVVHNRLLVLLLGVIVAGIISAGAALVSIAFKDRERSQFVYSLSIMAVTSLSYLLDVSPVKTLSRLAVGDYATHAADLLGFAAFLALLLALLTLAARRFAAQ